MHYPGSPTPLAASLLKAATAADRLGVSLRMLWTLVAKGDLKVVRFGRRTTRFEPSEVQALIERNRSRVEGL